MEWLLQYLEEKLKDHETSSILEANAQFQSLRLQPKTRENRLLDDQQASLDGNLKRIHQLSLEMEVVQYSGILLHKVH